MEFLKFLWLCLFSSRGEDEGENTQQGGSGDGSGEDDQGDQSASAEDNGQQGGQGQSGDSQQADTLAELTEKLNQIQEQYETLKGQSGATERNLAAERKALESMGLKVVRDHEGNVQVLPVQKQGSSRFTDEHKSKFFSYFPDAQSGENFLNLLNTWAEDRFGEKLSKYDKTLSERQKFQSIQAESGQKMLELFPSLNRNDKEFNKTFYDKATEIWQQNYSSLPNGELIAANQAAIEMGISPATISKARTQGFQKAKDFKRIVGQGSQSQSDGNGFKKLSFEDYSNLSPADKKKYDQEEVMSRK